MTFEMTWPVTVLVDAWPNNALLLTFPRTPASLSLRSIKAYIRTSTIHDASPIAFRFADSLDRTVLTKEMDPARRWRASLYEKNCSLNFHFPKQTEAFSCFCSRATTAKEWTKKLDARAEMLFCKSKPIAFLPLSLPSPSLFLKIPKDNTHYHTYRVHNIGYTPWPMFHWSLVLTQMHILMKQKIMLCNENNHIYLVWLCQSNNVVCRVDGAN